MFDATSFSLKSSSTNTRFLVLLLGKLRHQIGCPCLINNGLKVITPNRNWHYDTSFEIQKTIENFYRIKNIKIRNYIF